MGPATGLTCPHSLVADGPLEADALLALEEALRVDLGLDRLELREAVRAPDALLQREALLFLLGVRKRYRTKLKLCCNGRRSFRRSPLSLVGEDPMPNPDLYRPGSSASIPKTRVTSY